MNRVRLRVRKTGATQMYVKTKRAERGKREEKRKNNNEETNEKKSATP